MRPPTSWPEAKRQNLRRLAVAVSGAARGQVRRRPARRDCCKLAKNHASPGVAGAGPQEVHGYSRRGRAAAADADEARRLHVRSDAHLEKTVQIRRAAPRRPSSRRRRAAAAPLRLRWCGGSRAAQTLMKTRRGFHGAELPRHDRRRPTRDMATATVSLVGTNGSVDIARGAAVRSCGFSPTRSSVDDDDDEPSLVRCLLSTARSSS